MEAALYIVKSVYKWDTDEKEGDYTIRKCMWYLNGEQVGKVTSWKKCIMIREQ